MKFLRVIFVIGYIFWGGMFLYAFSELMLRNAWLDLFEIEETTPSYIEFIELEKESTRIKYVFEYNEKNTKEVEM